MLPRELVPNLRGGLQLQLDLIYFVKLYENEDDEVEYAFRAGLRFLGCCCPIYKELHIKIYDRPLRLHVLAYFILYLQVLCPPADSL